MILSMAVTADPVTHLEQLYLTWHTRAFFLVSDVVSAAVAETAAALSQSVGDSTQQRQSNGLRSLNSRYSLISIAFERYCLAIFHSISTTTAAAPVTFLWAHVNRDIPCFWVMTKEQKDHKIYHQHSTGHKYVVKNTSKVENMTIRILQF